MIPSWAAGKTSMASPIHVVNVWSALPQASYLPNSQYTSDGFIPTRPAHSWWLTLGTPHSSPRTSRERHMKILLVPSTLTMVLVAVFLSAACSDGGNPPARSGRSAAGTNSATGGSPFTLRRQSLIGGGERLTH